MYGVFFIASEDADDRYWIGATDIQIEGEWRRTVLGELIGYTNWYNNGKPDNAGGNENCMELLKGGYWNDNQCTKQTFYICEERYALCDEKTVQI